MLRVYRVTYSRFHWVATWGRWFAFDTNRVMVPVDKARNPFTGIRNWSVRIGHFSIRWR